MEGHYVLAYVIIIVNIQCLSTHELLVKQDIESFHTGLDQPFDCLVLPSINLTFIPLEHLIMISMKSCKHRMLVCKYFNTLRSVDIALGMPRKITHNIHFPFTQVHCKWSLADAGSKQAYQTCSRTLAREQDGSRHCHYLRGAVFRCCVRWFAYFHMLLFLGSRCSAQICWLEEGISTNLFISSTLKSKTIMKKHTSPGKQL